MADTAPAPITIRIKRTQPDMQITKTFYQVFNQWLERNHEWDYAGHISFVEIRTIMENLQEYPDDTDINQEAIAAAIAWYAKSENTKAYHAIVSSYVKQFQALNPGHPLSLRVDEHGTLWIKPSYAGTNYPTVDDE